ncbi:arsenic resistance protein [Paenibacillus pinihumi]|uniref:arsenic resistance protein n=1 Tax=Paenibacillus pinihumi TaxID=669462 RepID=UPI0003FE1BF4|nr:bile acid:sodium symporter [Paenibacillus pinihumi]
MFSREKLEQHQAGLYAVILIISAALGLFAPGLTAKLDNSILISVIIAILMYGMFTQIPFVTIKESFRNLRFIWAILTVNYVAVPAVVWVLSQFLPDHPPVLLGVYLVLLAPCIDYVIVFTYLGRGNEKLMLMSTPVLFITQMILLPLYLWLFMGKSAAEIVNPGPFIEAFVIIILLPLIIAVMIQLISRKAPSGQALLDFSAWIPVPLMALTLFVVVTSQIGKLSDHIELIIKVIPVYIAFMAIMPFIGRLIVKWFRLDVESGRAVIFSGGTRNSLVVLPLALSLPDNWSTLVAAIIVTQTIVELAGELIYIRFVPNVILKDSRERTTKK